MVGRFRVASASVLSPETFPTVLMAPLVASLAGAKMFVTARMAHPIAARTPSPVAPMVSTRWVSANLLILTKPLSTS